MFEKGSIIQYFRQKKGLTQEELGHGICSKTHLSKIERGLTEVSDETISLLCERMGFDIDEEIDRLKNVQKMLETLQKLIIFQDKIKAREVLSSLEIQEFEYITPLHIRFLLLKTRQLLLDGRIEEAKNILFSKEIQNQKIPQLEEDLLNHTLGIYYIQTYELHKAIEYLKKVSFESYNNPEIHYHLALAYCHLNAHISSYHHCQKAKEYFVYTNNYHRLLDTETIALILLEEETHLLFNEIESRYENLLDSVRVIKDQDREAYLLHNFAYQLYKFKKYNEARNYYKKALTIGSKESVNYLTALFGYMRCIYVGKLENEATIIEIINEGIKEAKEKNVDYYFMIFNLYKYKLCNNQETYFNYLSNTVLPFLYEIKNKEFFIPLTKEYIQYLISIKDGQKILDYMNNYQINYTLED
ncbi:helix-turn-helix domain-containing protein [Gottfriedia luciferensis]|uniref:helix-turn-helix domain-containing protein n=1 Tax=Gottfriedia luciferensis TaxID=178774 RepID=UPI000B451908|nr:helix-turn-helix transcriptional regulator [Gottfriedia luciferensis]